MEAATLRLIARRFLPLLLAAYLDRVNVGFAALTANKDLCLIASWFGWGAGVFFIGNFLFEFPSNLLLERDHRASWRGRARLPAAA